MDLVTLLEREREQLLDIGTRNRLVSTPRHNKRSKMIEVIHERSVELFELLVRQKRTMTFLPLGNDNDSGEADQAADSQLTDRQMLLYSLAADESDAESPDHFTDTKLQTELSPKKLQRRLRDIHNDCRTYLEEQGVNPLFLALGFLRWRESESSTRERYAPLILLPVEVDRTSVTSQFRLSFTDDELSTNLSLQQKLKSDFDLVLPDLPVDEDLNVDEYFDEVAAAVSRKQHWEVLRDDVQLNFFQFAKFLMYRDLDPANWPTPEQLLNHDVLSQLLTDGFEQPEPIIPSSGRIDDYLPAQDMVHVVDADSSQTAAIEEVRQGRHLVIQGPPGTGKSQTITNLIATAVRDGKKVLFLSEKMAALEVVKSRLERIGLGDTCLELHSQKSRKRQVLDELGNTLKLRRSTISVDHSANANVDRLKVTLNSAVDALHTPVGCSGLTPFQIFGRLIHLHDHTEFDDRVRGAARLKSVEDWDTRTVGQLRQSLEDLVALTKAVGKPQSHTFRGARCGVLLRSDTESIREYLKQGLQTVNDLIKTSVQVARAIGVGTGGGKVRSRDVVRLCELADAIADSPVVDPDGIQHEAWEKTLPAIEEVVKAGLRYRTGRERLDGRLNDGALEIPVAEARRHLNAYGRQFFLFRMFNSKFRSAKNTLRELLNEEIPENLDAQLQLFDDVIACQKFTKAAQGDGRKVGACADAFGQQWQGEDSDWQQLQLVVDWVKRCTAENLHSKFRLVRARFKGDAKALRNTSRYAMTLVHKLPEVFASLCQRLDLDLATTFDCSDVADLNLQSLTDWLQRATADIESLADWVRYRLRRDDTASGGLRPIVRLLDKGAVSPVEAEDLFALTYHEHLLRSAYQQRPTLAEFKGLTFESIRERFCDAEHTMLKATRSEVSSVHRGQIPGGTIGGMGVLRHELQKKSRHKAIRRLLREAGPAIQNIKPVFMMSPLSIAQYLEPGVAEFDLLLIDEASQVEPVDALGAIARCQQIVVVGDDKQLPPTKFFAKEADRGDDDEADLARDLESILGLCVARGIQQRMLSWHYRSQHQSLIQVSNHEYYNDELFVVPSPIRDDPAYGLHFQFVENGVYERGKSRTNPIEARVVAEHIIRHVKEFPNLTLGVGAFSVKQRDAIRDELELIQRDNPQLAAFFAESQPEPFFIKNLENIQGDERDVIFISVCYGKDPDGYMTQSYGPLNRDGGERRLNVLITRARRKTLVFASITADDIDLHRARKRGVVGLKKFLQFAQHGYSDVGETTGRDHDSEFELEVAKAIGGYGHTVEAQIGAAGFFIDLAIVDPNQPGRYLLGIECDGASYHSSRSARDRDRLREEVLKNRGWKIHRIWSSDWYQQPQATLKQVLTAIELASIPQCNDAPSNNEPGCDETDAACELDQSDAIGGEEEPTSIDNEMDAMNHEYGIPVVPYVETTRIPSPKPVMEMLDHVLRDSVISVVQTEGPVHTAEVARRLAALSGTRAGSRVAERVMTTIRGLVHRGLLKKQGDFCWHLDQSEIVVRDRANVGNATLRKPENLPPQEIAAAAAQLIKANCNAERPDLVRAIAAVFGYRQAGAKLRGAIEPVIDRLIETGALVDRESVLSLGDVQSATGSGTSS
jgi:very-short-patch-repair endonuclease